MDSSRPPDIVVVAGGQPVVPSALPALPAGAVVIAADSGVELALELGLAVSVAVGDFDSLRPDLVDRLDDIADEVRRVDTDKDFTDLELALDVAVEQTGRVLVLGLEGGRPDHALANLLVAAAPRFAALDIELVLDRGRAWVVRDTLVGRLPVGAVISVIPVHGPATLTLAGVRWPLDHVTLGVGSTRGVSNEITAPTFEVAVHGGVVLCIAPHPEENQ